MDAAKFCDDFALNGVWRRNRQLRGDAREKRGATNPFFSRTSIYANGEFQRETPFIVLGSGLLA